MTPLSHDSAVTNSPGSTAIAKETFYNLPPAKREKIIRAGEDEFAAYGYDLASIQRIIIQAGIPRGSFYQYFEDKRDLYIELLHRAKETKFHYLQPAIDTWRSTNLFEFLEQITRLGMEYAKANPKMVSIGEDLLRSRTLDIERLREELLDSSEDTPELGTYRFYLQLLRRAQEQGEIDPGLSAEKAALFTKALMESISRSAMLEDETEFEEFFGYLRYGLANKKEGEE